MKYFLCACLSLVLVLTLSACGTAKEIPSATFGAASSQSESEPPISSVPVVEVTSSVSVEDHTSSALAENKTELESQATNSQTVSGNESKSGEETTISQTRVVEETTLQISIQVNENTVTFELSDSQAAKDLYHQLPLSIAVENYSDNEKIFYPTKALDVTDAPLHKGGGSGTLAYYAPWDNVVIFYGDSSPAGGLYELGHAILGSEHISAMSGTLEVAQVTDK